MNGAGRLTLMRSCLIVVACLLIGGGIAFAAGRVNDKPAAPMRLSAGKSRVTPAAIADSPTSALAPRPEQTREPDPLMPAAAFLPGRLGTAGVAVYDLATGQTWTAGDAGQPQDEASVVKVGVLETLLYQRPAGLTSAQAALAQQMIEDSDNDAATALWDAAGGTAGMRAFGALIGLSGTTPSACVQCPGFPWPGWGLTTTTPLDQLRLLRELVSPHSVLSAAEREFALRLMEDVTPDQRWGVSDGVPSQAMVALKNGWLPLNAAATDWQINSIGWVDGLGRDYLIAVLSTGNPTEAYGIDTIDEVSALVWRQLGQS
jgi:hypothetical protein